MIQVTESLIIIGKFHSRKQTHMHVAIVLQKHPQ